MRLWETASVVVVLAIKDADERRVRAAALVAAALTRLFPRRANVTRFHAVSADG